MVEYRPVPDDRRETLSRMLSYAFNPADGPADVDPEEPVPPRARVGENRGLFSGEEIRSVCRHIFFDARVRESAVPVAGLSAVATPPEHRRQGLIERLLRESLREYRDRDVPFSVLWPFETAFYAQFGWATAHRVAVQRAAPTVFRIGDPPQGRYRRSDPEDWRALDAVLANHARDHELAIDRSERWWRDRAFHGWETDPYVYRWERDDPAGYVVYSITEEGGKTRLEVWDLAYVDADAKRATYRFLADHDSQVSSVHVPVPPSEVLIDAVDEPEDLDVEIRPGAMIRIVDVERALAAVGAPESVSGTATLAVEDSLLDWNDDTVTVRYDGGDVFVESTTDAPDVHVGIDALSQLLVGYRDLNDLERADDLTVRVRSGASVLDAAYPASSVFVRERF